MSTETTQKVRAIPEGMHSLTAQLTLDGAAAAIEFYKRAFGAVEILRAPDPSGAKIWHAMLRIGDSVFFVNDTFPEMGGVANQAQMWLYTDGVDDAWKRATDAGLKTMMPVADMFWGDRMGTGTDAWGNRWTLCQHVKDMSPAELQAAQDAAVKEWNARK